MSSQQLHHWCSAWPSDNGPHHPPWSSGPVARGIRAETSLIPGIPNKMPYINNLTTAFPHKTNPERTGEERLSPRAARPLLVPRFSPSLHSSDSRVAGPAGEFGAHCGFGIASRF